MLVLLEMSYLVRIEDVFYIISICIMLKKIIRDLNVMFNGNLLVLFEKYFLGGLNVCVGLLLYYVLCRKVLMINRF